jgi:hypothetical protein
MIGPAVEELNHALAMRSSSDRDSIAALHNFLADDFLGKQGTFKKMSMSYRMNGRKKTDQLV